MQIQKKMARKKETITLSIPPGTKEKLEQIAAKLEIKWGERPSISGLLTAIASEDTVSKKLFKLNNQQVEALEKAMKTMIDHDHIEEAKILVNMLLDHGNLEKPMAQSLRNIVQQPAYGWRSQLDEYIKNQQCFYLSYGNSQGEQLGYTVRFAEIKRHEKRYYLNIWCEETQDIIETPYPELIHNRCLRLDRINKIEKIHGHWKKDGLEQCKVYLHFYGWMAKAYESKVNDISNELIGDVRQVIRKVSNPFWLIREIQPYGKNCEIIAPEKIREKYFEEIKEIYSLYR